MIVIVPGFFTPKENFEVLKKTLRDKTGQKVLVLDIHKTPDLLGWVSKVKTLIKSELNPSFDESVHIIGHSVGGLCAQLLLRGNPKWTATLLSPAPPRLIPLGGLELHIRMLKNMWDLFTKEWLTPHLRDVESLGYNNQVVLSKARPEPTQTLWNVINLFKRGGHMPKLGSRIQILCGTKDRFVTLGTCKRIAKYHGCKLTEVKNGHHTLSVTEYGVEAILESVKDFGY